MIVVMGRRLYISLIAMMLLSFTVCEQATAQIVRSTPKRETTPKQNKPKTTTTNKPNKTTTRKTSQRTRSTGSSSRSSVTAVPSSSSAANSSTVYDVTFTCNMDDADLYIDNAYMGYANGTYNIKGGSHYVHVVAEGCDDYTTTINVSSSRRSFKLNMNNDISQPLHTLLDDMVFVQGGSFIMGTKEEAGAEFDEMPAHEVKLSSFYICKYEVTQDLWIEVMGNNPSENVDESLPVESITWDDCQLFIKKLNAMTGIKFRLPTEAEWEFAARGGVESRGYKYAGSDSINDVAWCYDFDETTHAVGSKAPNELGLYDMSGNVMEWCSDWHGHYKPGLQRNPTGPRHGEYRVCRGGFWESEPSHCTVSYRVPVAPEDHSSTLGFRLAATSIKSKR